MTSLGSLRHWPLAPLLYGSYLGQKIRLKLLDFLRKSKCPAIARDAESMTNAWWLSINGPVKPSKSFGKVVGIICIFFNLLHSRTKKTIVTPPSHVESLRLMGNPSAKYTTKYTARKSISVIYYRLNKFQKYLGLKIKKRCGRFHFQFLPSRDQILS